LSLTALTLKFSSDYCLKGGTFQAMQLIKVVKSFLNG